MRVQIKATSKKAQLSSAKASEQKQNRQALLAVVMCLRYLARQGLTLRGVSPIDDTIHGNFEQLLLLKANENTLLKNWLKLASATIYILLQSQNKILEIMYRIVMESFSPLSSLLTNVLQRCNLSISNLCGQTYKGAFNMAGAYRGTQAFIMVLQPLASYAH